MGDVTTDKKLFTNKLPQEAKQDTHKEPPQRQEGHEVTLCSRTVAKAGPEGLHKDERPPPPQPNATEWPGPSPNVINIL